MPPCGDTGTLVIFARDEGTEFAPGASPQSLRATRYRPGSRIIITGWIDRNPLAEGP
jgi:hypothetical protein